MIIHGREEVGVRVECLGRGFSGRVCGTQRLLSLSTVCFVCGSGMYKLVDANACDEDLAARELLEASEAMEIALLAGVPLTRDSEAVKRLRSAVRGYALVRAGRVPA